MAARSDRRSDNLLARLGAVGLFDELTAQVAALNEPVGEGPHAFPKPVRASVDSTSLQLFNAPVPTYARVEATARITGTEPEALEVDLFDTGVPITLHASQNLAIFDVKAALGVDAEVDRPFNATAGTLKFHGSVGAELRYRHYLPATETWLRKTAYEKVVFGSRLPVVIDLSRPLALGEAHEMTARLWADFNLGLDYAYGFAETRALELTTGLAPSFTFEMKASLAASMGLGYTSRVRMVVARAGLRNDGWTRVHMKREDTRRLSFGVTVGLDLTYDLGTSLGQIFEQAVSAVPTPRLVRTAREILGYAKNPAGLETVLVGEAAEVLEDLFEDKILGPVTADNRVKKLMAFAEDVVEFYDNLDGEIRGLWDRLLSKVDLDPGSAQGEEVRRWLDRLATLDDDDLSIETLLDNEDASRLIDWIEALSGTSIEELLISDQVEETLGRVARLAEKARSLLDTDEQVIAKIRAFADATGIDAIVNDLRILTSPQALRDEARKRIQRVAERLVGKAFDLIDEEDLAAIKAWAEKTDDLLSHVDLSDPTSKANEFVATLKGHAEKVKLDYGLSLTAEFERINRDSALFDFEIKPEASVFNRQVSDALRFVDVPKVVALMTNLETDNSEAETDPESVPFLIRELVLTSERVSTSSFSSMLNLIGFGRAVSQVQSGRTQRVERSTIRVSTDDAGASHRDASYSAGLIRTDNTPAIVTSSAVWLDIDETESTGTDIAAAYNGERTSTLKLRFTAEDATTSNDELTAIEHFLVDLGFREEGDPSLSSVLTDNAASRLAVSIEIPLLVDTSAGDTTDVLAELAAEAATTAGRKKADHAFLEASERWLQEGMVTDIPEIKGRRFGNVVAAFVDSPWYVLNGTSTGAIQGAPMQPRSFVYDGATIPIRFDPPDQVGSYVLGLTLRREEVASSIKALASAWSRTERRDRGYRGFSEAGSEFLRTVWMRGNRWPVSSHGLWLWLGLFSALRPESLDHAKGIATFAGVSKDVTEIPTAAESGAVAGATSDEPVEVWQRERPFVLDPERLRAR
ncbi:MAG: hypothetical protein AAGD38_05840, partial [Acidobacteriota bacterium]